MTQRVHPIETESYRILRERVDLSKLPPNVAAVTARVIHESADLELSQLMVLDDASVSAGIEAVAAAGPNGIPTRSADAITRAAERWPVGAVFVIGCAPTALFEVVRLVESGVLRPALVIGMPVGFVGAAEAKG